MHNVMASSKITPQLGVLMVDPEALERAAVGLFPNQRTSSFADEILLVA